MTRHLPRDPGWRWLAATVLAHLVVSLTHGRAHVGARVFLSPLATVFVFAVILAGPLAGLALSWWTRRLGCWLIAVTMAGSLIFGVVNHFVLAGPDHASSVDPEWRGLFATTAALVALTEALGTVLAIRLARQPSPQSAPGTRHQPGR